MEPLDEKACPSGSQAVGLEACSVVVLGDERRGLLGRHHILHWVPLLRLWRHKCAPIQALSRFIIMIIEGRG